MAHLHIVNKALLVLMAPENGVWSELLMAPKQAIIHAITNVAPSTLTNWRRAKPAATNTEAGIVKAMLKYAANPKQTISVRGAEANGRSQTVGDLLKDPTGVKLKDFAERLKEFFSTEASMNDGKTQRAADSLVDIAHFFRISPNVCRKIIDEAIYAVYPVFPSMYWNDESEADGELRALQGSYKASLRRNNLWIIADIRVRYTIKIGDGWTIRCKMRLPALDDGFGVRSWEYDGFVSVRSGSLFWMFEMRLPTHSDYIYLITKLVRIENGRGLFTGEYLTTGQDLPIRSVVSGQALLEKRAEDLDQVGEDGRPVFSEKSESKAEGRLARTLDETYESLTGIVLSKSSHQTKPPRRVVAA